MGKATSSGCYKSHSKGKKKIAKKSNCIPKIQKNNANLGQIVLKSLATLEQKKSKELRAQISPKRS